MRAASTVLSLLMLGSCSHGGRTARIDDTDSRVQLIPTIYVTDRFFAQPVTATGDTVILLLDTGDNGRLFEASVERLRWPVDTVKTSRGVARVAALPAFAPSRSVPAPSPMPVNGTRIVVTPPTDAFDTLMSKRTIGQLGQPWFAGRVWTFDYPRHRLLLRSQMPERRGGSDRDIRFDYRTDTAGQPFNFTPRVGVEIDGDSLLLIFDTGATVWLTDDALATLHDGQPEERAWSLVRNATYRKWRARHPSWRVVEKASRLNGSDIIEVPSVRIAGVDVGPVWFGTLPDRSSTTPVPRRVVLDGTLGGSALRFFTVTLDYPNTVARFARPEPE